METHRILNQNELFAKLKEVEDFQKLQNEMESLGKKSPKKAQKPKTSSENINKNKKETTNKEKNTKKEKAEKEKIKSNNDDTNDTNDEDFDGTILLYYFTTFKLNRKAKMEREKKCHKAIQKRHFY